MVISSIDSAIDQAEEYLEQDEAIPVISGFLVGFLFLISGYGYALIEAGTMLLFYAVLVRMWTSITPSDSELLRGSRSHFIFLVMSAGAVSIGIMVERGVAYFSGFVLPAQFLALAVLTSRIYLKMRSGLSLREAILWENTHERYVVLIPCLVVLLLPIAIHQLGISSLILVDADVFVSRTIDAFLSLTFVGIISGALAYLRFEEGLGTGS